MLSLQTERELFTTTSEIFSMGKLYPAFPPTWDYSSNNNILKDTIPFAFWQQIHILLLIYMRISIDVLGDPELFGSHE